MTVIAIGNKVAKAVEFAENCRENGKSVEVINARFLKPLDVETLKISIEKTKRVITMEDGTLINGLATAVKELIVDESIDGVNMEVCAFPDEFIKHGTVEELEKIYVDVIGQNVSVS